MKLSPGLLFFSFATTPMPKATSILDQRDAAPPGFTTQGPADPNAVLQLRIGLKQKDMAGLEEELYAVSTTSSPRYGQHLTLDEVKAFASPTPETVSVVTQWLTENGITGIKTSGAYDDWLAFSVPVAQANQLLNAKFETFTHEGGSSRIRTLSYSVPSDLVEHIELIHPTTSFAKPLVGRPNLVSVPVPQSARNITQRANPTPSSCNSTITPACLQALYGIPTTRATQASNKLAVAGFTDQWAQTADLHTFLMDLRPDLPSTTTFTLQTLDGGTNPQGAANAGIEADLDIEYTVGIASGVPTLFISVGESNTDGLDGFLDLINFLSSESAPPQVLTTSYGFDETDISAAAATRLCNAYMAIGARGVSVIFSSGKGLSHTPWFPCDGGVAGSQSQSCTTFIPAFPGGCPFLTAVGSTHGISEVGSTFSSGGFSNVFARPSYQNSQVAAYLAAIGSTNAGLFNRSGRGFPDVAAQGENVEIVWGGKVGSVDGTSCASPIFASVVSLINDRLIAAGASPLGFLNPFIYANPQAFFDITSGNNPGCGTTGFIARAGWDPVSGMGTPNFPALLSAAGCAAGV